MTCPSHTSLLLFKFLVKYFFVLLCLNNPNPERGETSSRQLNGLPATWAANSLKTFRLQYFAMVQARTQANSIDVWVRKSTPLVGYVHEG